MEGALDWEHLAATKRESIDSLIPEPWRLREPIPSAHDQRDVTGRFIQQYLDSREVEITETDAVGIVKHTSTGQWTAKEVMRAFCHRASLAHQFTHCLHEIFFDAALEDADRLDEYFHEHRAPVGPLHGLPVSLKDQFHVKGVETTMGYVGWIGTFQGQKDTGRERIYESEMAKELRAAGALLYCKTSVPHTLMTGETVNNIIGYTTNPKNRHLSCGGSSGGEGALIALRGSPGGFGTDIGGSIRIPAAFNGLYGIRPSSGRLPYEGMANSMDGQNSMLSVVGPLAQTAASLRLLVKSVLEQEPWLHDPLVVEMPWRPEQEEQVKRANKTDDQSSERLAFGVLRQDGVVNPHPPVRRAIDVVVETLKKLGHQVIDWKPPSHERGNALALKTWRYDGGRDVHKDFALSGEPIAPQVSQTYGQTPIEEATATDIAQVNVAKREWQKEYLEYWNGTSETSGTGRPVDAVIAPLAPFAAARPKEYHYYGYSVFVNALDYTSCVVPVTQVDKAVDGADVGYEPLNQQDEAAYKSYDPDVYDGAYVGVQLVGRRFQEEKMLAVAELVGDALAG
ncbi:MAG: Acetamidase [Piccolia ochrophora]|nr:MAG: Acetamidase [Piccolia ochrophora]